MLYRLALSLEIEALIEISVQVFLHAWRKERFILGAWDDHVACARIRLLNAVIKESLVKTHERASRHFRAR